MAAEPRTSVGRPAASKSLPRPTHARAAKETTASKTDGEATAHMLIFTGRLGVQVANVAFADTLDAVVEIATERGGYVARQTDRSVEVRVPSARFREAMKAIEKLGVVTRRSVQAQDVSEKYFDTKVRLKSLRATRDRLQVFLQRAKTIQEVLRVEQELNRLNAQIDHLEGRLRFLASKVAFSTILVDLQPKPKPKVVVVRKAPPPPAPRPPRSVALPIHWLNQVGLNRLLELE